MKLSRSTVVAVVVVVAATLGLVSCLDDGGLQSPVGPSFTTSSGPVTFVGVGNIAKCGSTIDDATAALLDAIPGTVFTLGDAAYDNGTLTQYNSCYGPSWGRHKERTKPAPGDRDYKTAGAAGYFGYFGAAAGDPTKGYYSYDLGAWHVVVLNSGSTAISMAVGSPQEQWLRADLAAHPALCTIAYWHHPLFDSKDAPNLKVRPLWDALYAAGVDVVVNAHYSFYERFAPQTSAGIADPAFGIREFVVGTGGAQTQNPDHLRPNSEARNGTTPGVLKLTLTDTGYDWQFIPVPGKTFTDAGSGACHDASTANHAPTAVAGGPYTSTPGTALAFNGGGSSDPDGDPLTYAWSFGDGGTGTTATPSHVYATPGTYTVTLTVTDSRGAASVPVSTIATIFGSSSVLLAAGDISSCGVDRDELTARILDTIPGTVLTLGDNVFPDGTLSEYQNCYDPTWGRHKARTYATLGNHEYNTGTADGSFDYFGDRAGPRGLGYYSFDIGAWHIIVLNSNRNFVSVSAGSPQDLWLQADLAANTKKCTLAAFHHPRFFSSFDVGFTSSGPIKNFWDRLYAAGADVVLNAQFHHYERLAPMTPTGALDTETGIREFNVGSGGESTSLPTVIAPNSEVLSDAYGVLKVTLLADSYTWEFRPMEGQTFTDAGSGTCHDAPTGANRAPTAAPSGPYAGGEGAAVSFNGSGSSDPDGDALTYAWSFGDGASGTGPNPTHAYADNGAYTVALTVTDTHGAASPPVTTTATIANAAPSVNAGPNQTALLGSPFTLNVAFSDPGVNDGPWAYTINWGDGATATTGSATSQTDPVTATHTYVLPGSHTVQVAMTDKDGGVGAAQLTVTASLVNREPAAAPGGPYSGVEGVAVSFDGNSSSDPDGDALTYAWSFGDGSSGTGVRPSHAYADNGSYTVSLTVTDAHGAASAPALTTAMIANAAPVVSAGPDQTVTVGTSVSVNATFSDLGLNDAPWAYTIEWGDGSAATAGSTTSQTTPITATHVYSAAGSNTVRVSVTDKDGGTGSAQLTMSVGTSVTLVGAGNIARCDRTGDEATAALLDAIPGTVVSLGDAAYPGGTPASYQNCYAPTWGRHKARTTPVPGHRDYDSSATAAGYFGYWGAQAGDPTKGYYSYDLGAWHIIVLNSINAFVSTAVGSPQETWLRADLAATTQQCVLALFHNPRFFSTTGTLSPTGSVKPFWDDLYAARAELIVNAHLRDYERFAPQTSAGVADPVNGIREFVVGTGGEGLDLPNTMIAPNSEVNISGVFGVLKLTLSVGSYAWEFVPVAGQTATDSGSGTCH